MQDVVAEIERKLEERKPSVYNKNAVAALLTACSNPVEALGKIFLGREDAVEVEKAKLQQDAILAMVIKIASALEEYAAQDTAGSIILNGTIEAKGRHGDHVVGAEIAGRQAVHFQPGTRITAEGGGGGSVTGLKIVEDER
ncbi:hypothetical protein ACK32Z_02970 [Aeromonas hydrophila]|uniref:hypothetical protein n=1 Tax=Aeromonas hydrophila TaxID=644 RepID=UPI00398575E2